MTNFTFRCDRSTAPEHQVDGIQCSKAIIAGAAEFKTTEEAFIFAKSLLPIRGTWRIEIGRGDGQQILREVVV